MLEARCGSGVIREELKRAFPSISFGIGGDSSLAFHVRLAGENKDLQRLLHAREYIRMGGWDIRNANYECLLPN